jgi:hypothetical protein
MTNVPGDETPPQDPYGPPGQGSSPGYGPPSYGQPPEYGQAPYGQPPEQGQYGAQPPYAAGYPAPDYSGQGYSGYPPQGYVRDHPKATTSLVLGILGIVVCGLVAPFAWRMGKRTVDEIDASNGQLGGRGSAKAGYVLGLIGTLLLGLAVLFFVAVVLLGLATSVTSGTST